MVGVGVVVVTVVTVLVVADILMTVAEDMTAMMIGPDHHIGHHPAEGGGLLSQTGGSQEEGAGRVAHDATECGII